MLNRIFGLIMVLCFLFSSCNFGYQSLPVNNNQKLQNGELSNIAERIRVLQNFGFFPEVTSASRSIEHGFDFPSLSSDVIEKMQILATDPLFALQEIKNSPDGDIHISLIETLLSDEATAGDVYTAMYNISPEMANNFVAVLSDQSSTQFENIEFSQQSRMLIANGNTDLFSIKLQHTPVIDNSRSVMSSKLNDTTVGLYVGYCVLTTAGLITASTAAWYQPWLIPIGLGVAAGGYALIAAQLFEWYQKNSDFQRFVRAIMDAIDCGKKLQSFKNPQDALKYVEDYFKGKSQSELFSTSHVEHLKGIAKAYYGSFYETYKYLKEVFSSPEKTAIISYLLSISSWTSVPCVLGYSNLRGPVTNEWNKFVDGVSNAMPGVNITIAGIPIKRI